MPRKIRALVRELKRAGFVNRGGKGDHRNFEHPRGQRVTVSGNLGDDAKPYQESEVRRAIKESQS
jgi:predicted RNA binding protein YcfA (HicA-like mRNA interferase family)